MGALAHYLEREGIATTGISLVRAHTEKIQPPRALWCPFELGRPFGAPNEPEFQTRVIKTVLSLLERETGPVLEDFPEEPPSAPEENPGDMEGWTCPVNFGDGSAEIDVDTDPASALAQEVDQLRSWYDLALEKNKRTTVGISEVPLGELSKYLVSFLEDQDTPLPRPDLPVHQNVKLAVDEHRAFYYEASAARPGNPSDTEIADWYYEDSVLGQLLVKLNSVCAGSDDPILVKMSDRRIIPVRQRHLKGQKVNVPAHND